MTILVWICKFEKIAWFFLSATERLEGSCSYWKRIFISKIMVIQNRQEWKIWKIYIEKYWIEQQARDPWTSSSDLSWKILCPKDSLSLLERFSVRSRIGNSVTLTNHQEEKSIDPCWRQKKRRNYLKIKYKSMNYRYRNYKTLGLPIEVSGFRDLSESNAASDPEVSFLICPFCKISEPCSHCPK